MRTEFTDSIILIFMIRFTGTAGITIRITITLAGHSPIRGDGVIPDTDGDTRAMAGDTILLTGDITHRIGGTIHLTGVEDIIQVTRFTRFTRVMETMLMDNAGQPEPMLTETAVEQQEAQLKPLQEEIKAETVTMLAIVIQEEEQLQIQEEELIRRERG